MRTKLAALMSILLVVAGCSSQIANDGSGVGNPLGTRFMKHCESSANSSPYKQEQLDFLDDHEVTVHEENEESFWIDHEVDHPDFGMGIEVRYFAGKKADPPCIFGLVLIANHPEVGEAMARYTRDGRPFQPTDKQWCRSYKPPTITEKDEGPVVTLRCDIVT